MGCRRLPDGGYDAQQRLDVERFSQILCHGRRVGTKMVIAPPSVSSVSLPANRHWQAQNFRVVNRGQAPARTLLDVFGRDRPQILVLCTGDGSYVRTVRELLLLGWRVELRCWRATCNGGYTEFANNPLLRGFFRICYLDDVRQQITFQQFVLEGSSRFGITDMPPSPPQPRVPSPLTVALTAQPATPEQDDCLVCLSAVASCEYLPCRHRVLCTRCAQQLLQDLRDSRGSELGSGQRQRAWMACCILCGMPWTSISPAAEFESLYF